MRIRRTLPVFVFVVLVIAAVVIAVQLRKHAPPEAARLLPGADAFIYADLTWVRKANAGKELPPVSHDPEYERFIRETGFQFERDLDEAAFAVHYPASWLGGGTGGSAPEPRFSEVLVGRFQSERLTAYLREMAKAVENYQSVDIFTIPVEGRSLRVAVLSADSVAASNHDDPAVIHGIVDRSRRLASPFGGPALLRQYYKDVQFASLAWAVARIEPSAGESSTWGSLFSAPATLVVSGSYLSPLHLNLRAGAIRLRAEAFTENPEQARALLDKANIFVALTHSAETSVGMHGTDPDVKAFFESIQTKQEGDRAILNAAMPYGFLRKMLAESTTDLPGPETPSPQAPAKSK
ncbi:MAG: hypothetical protein WB523_09690 [Candidatus Sulfotelmatobacter sp.]